MTELSSLSLYVNPISDITPLSNLNNLTALQLNTADQGNGISDVSPLKNLTKLSYLDLANNKITDLTPLQTLEGLEQLDLSNNPGLTKAEIDRYKKTLSFLKTRRLKIIHNSK